MANIYSLKMLNKCGQQKDMHATHAHIITRLTWSLKRTVHKLEVLKHFRRVEVDIQLNALLLSEEHLKAEYLHCRYSVCAVEIKWPHTVSALVLQTSQDKLQESTLSSVN